MFALTGVYRDASVAFELTGDRVLTLAYTTVHRLLMTIQGRMKDGVGTVCVCVCDGQNQQEKYEGRTRIGRRVRREFPASLGISIGSSLTQKVCGTWGA